MPEDQLSKEDLQRQIENQANHLSNQKHQASLFLRASIAAVGILAAGFNYFNGISYFSSLVNRINLQRVADVLSSNNPVFKDLIPYLLTLFLILATFYFSVYFIIRIVVQLPIQTYRAAKPGNPELGPILRTVSQNDGPRDRLGQSDKFTYKKAIRHNQDLIIDTTENLNKSYQLSKKGILSGSIVFFSIFALSRSDAFSIILLSIPAIMLSYLVFIDDTDEYEEKIQSLLNKNIVLSVTISSVLYGLLLQLDRSSQSPLIGLLIILLILYNIIDQISKRPTTFSVASNSLILGMIAFTVGISINVISGMPASPSIVARVFVFVFILSIFIGGTRVVLESGIQAIIFILRNKYISQFLTWR